MWNRSEHQIKFILIRHGATEANKEHRYLGKTDESLSAEGIEELQKEKCTGSYPPIDYLFASPMKRCIETSKILYSDKEPILIPEWKEMDFGVFEGKNYLDLQGDERYQAWFDSNGTLPFPEGESREAFIKRCEQGFYRMLTQLSKQVLNQNSDRKNPFITIGLIVHGGTIMALLSSFCGGEYFDYQVVNGKGYICKLECTDESIRLDALEKI